MDALSGFILLSRRRRGQADPPNQGQKKEATTKGGEAGEKGSAAGGAAKKQPPAGGGARGGAGAAAEQAAAGRDGITVVSAFEGYAFDAGMRAGDRITAINGKPVEGITVDKVGGPARVWRGVIGMYVWRVAVSFTSLCFFGVVCARV